MDEPRATLERGVDFLLYLLADALVDRNFPILDRFNDELEDLESAIFENVKPEHLQRIFEMKRALVTLRRVLSPQRDVLGLLAQRGIPNVGERTTLYFRDIYDHLVRLYEQIDSGRDLLGNVMDGYLSMVANRTNDITKQLTIFATIFLPLSFITGFFGQNFEHLNGPGFFWLMLGSVIAAARGHAVLVQAQAVDLKPWNWRSPCSPSPSMAFPCTTATKAAGCRCCCSTRSR